jgi:hypothetical protein
MLATIRNKIGKVKQVRQCRYNVTLRPVRATIGAVENKEYYRFSVYL